MKLPEDLKQYGVEHEDAFQLIEPETAAALMFAALLALVILERVGLL